MFEGSITGNYFIKLTNSYQNLFESKMVGVILKLSKIVDNTNSKYNANIFKCPITDENSNDRYANQCYSYNNLFEIIENNTIPTHAYYENRNLDTASLKLNGYLTFQLLNNNMETMKVALDERYRYQFYNSNLIFMLTNINSNYNIIIEDWQKRTIFSSFYYFIFKIYLYILYRIK